MRILVQGESFAARALVLGLHQLGHSLQWLSKGSSFSFGAELRQRPILWIPEESERLGALLQRAGFAPDSWPSRVETSIVRRVELGLGDSEFRKSNAVVFWDRQELMLSLERAIERSGIGHQKGVSLENAIAMGSPDLVFSDTDSTGDLVADSTSAVEWVDEWYFPKGRGGDLVASEFVDSPCAKWFLEPHPVSGWVLTGVFTNASARAESLRWIAPQGPQRRSGWDRVQALFLLNPAGLQHRSFRQTLGRVRNVAKPAVLSIGGAWCRLSETAGDAEAFDLKVVELASKAIGSPVSAAYELVSQIQNRFERLREQNAWIWKQSQRAIGGVGYEWAPTVKKIRQRVPAWIPRAVSSVVWSKT